MTFIDIISKREMEELIKDSEIRMEKLMEEKLRILRIELSDLSQIKFKTQARKK